MTRFRRLGAFIVYIAVLGACGGGDTREAVGPARDPLPECAYNDIEISTAGLPTPISTPGLAPTPGASPTGTPLGPFDPPDYANPPEGKVISYSETPGSDGQRIKEYAPLEIKMTDPEKTSIAGCPVHLRTYNQKLVGPTFRAKPGDTLKFSVDNQLDKEADSHADHANVTNLHTHGLHVYPGNGPDDRDPASDNVLINNPPPPNPQPYEIAIPPNHPSGTFWYHAHAHGSTAIQVGSGMSGAIIVEDDPARMPAPLKDIKEQVMVFQSLFYDQTGNAINPAPAATSTSPTPSPAAKAPSWQQSNRRITINGQVVPKITMRPGEVQRWRMIGSMFRETMSLTLAGHSLHEIALDSLYLPKVDTWGPTQSVDLHAGYRSDVLVQAVNTPGTYMMTDGEPPVNLAKDGETEDTAIVAAVVVEGEPINPPMSLPTDAQMQELAFEFDKSTGKLIDLESYWNANQRPIQSVIFDVGPVQTAPTPPIPTFTPSPPSPAPSPTTTPSPTQFSIDGKAFDPQNPADDRLLELGTVDKWELTSSNGIHLFHIHVNPFQVVRQGPNGPEQVWKDTFLVPGPSGKAPPFPVMHEPVIPPITIFTRYDDQYDTPQGNVPQPGSPVTVGGADGPPFHNFTGKYVIHCHFLDHEDGGMMQVVHLKKPPPPPQPPPPAI